MSVTASSPEVMRHRSASLAEVDPEVSVIIEAEKDRQEHNLELIASENVASRAVLEAVGSVMNDKYAEGYPAKRYYGGNENMDEVENLAVARCKELFGAEHANVQPHAGASTNMAVYFAALKPGDTILAMNLAHGGHLTHGSPVNFSGQLYTVVPYGVRQSDELIDYDELRNLAVEHRPKMIVGGATAYPRKIDFARMRAIADEVGAYLLVDMAHPAGLIAAGEYPSPIPHAHFVTTTTHKTLRGPRGGVIMCKAEFAQMIDKSVFPGLQGGPFMHCIAGKAVAFKEALTPEFRAYQRQVRLNAAALAASLVELGFRLVSGGTDSHLMLLDLSAKGLTGKVGQNALDKMSITTNKNMVPFDQQKPFVTSGIRIGTPAITSRGMKEPEMTEIATLMNRALESIGDDSASAAVRADVHALCARFPVHRLA